MFEKHISDLDSDLELELEKLIGNTPMIKIKYRYQNREGVVYAKLEYYNYTGSIKDRIASYIIKKSKEENILKENQYSLQIPSR